MVITSYHIQNVLRTYSQQISEGSRLARSRKPEKAEQMILQKYPMKPENDTWWIRSARKCSTI